MTAMVFPLWRVFRRGAGVALACAVSAWAGVPEPGIVLYGTVYDTAGGKRVTGGTLEIVYQETVSGKRVTNTVPLQNLGNAFSYVAEIRFESAVNGHPVTASDVFELPINGGPARTFTRSANFASTPATNVQAASETLNYSQKGRLQQFDLVLDTENDGMPDYWELQKFGTLARNGNQDADDDGATDRAEYRAGTDPNNTNSVFRITAIGRAGGTVTMRWKSVTGKTYGVHKTPAVGQGFAPVATNIMANSSGSETTLVLPEANGTNFYRIEVE